MTITLSDPLAFRLQQAAAQRGEDPNEYALAALTSVVEKDTATQADASDPDDALTDDERALVRADIERGLTDFSEGRYKAADDFYAEMQKKHGLFNSHG